MIPSRGCPSEIITSTLLTSNEPTKEEDAHDPVQGMSFTEYDLYLTYPQ